MPSTPISHAFGNVVRRRRDELGLSQEELAERAEVHPTYIGLVERCKRNCFSNADSVSAPVKPYERGKMRFGISFVQELDASPKPSGQESTSNKA
ncbi:MAG: helix-turn-helix transcriptional regulator [Verrucomicrobiaceae bacterium]|nr:helix-turn-helix transcriptional regulator [Verrucomicrobiaceae bacterium]